jgi:hypothetical protein
MKNRRMPTIITAYTRKNDARIRVLSVFSWLTLIILFTLSRETGDGRNSNDQLEC